ncbi:hypothetical protein GCM10018790_33570 [Kitasatospora xanthocidica]|nr:hypothetical protein GCM10018790_33570 [Kitasatospora xanthocidica]
MLEPVLDLGALPASLGGLGERGGALFRGKGRKSHAVHLRCGWKGLSYDWFGTQDTVRKGNHKGPDLRDPHNSRLADDLSPDTTRIAAPRQEKNTKSPGQPRPTRTFPGKMTAIAKL